MALRGTLLGPRCAFALERWATTRSVTSEWVWVITKDRLPRSEGRLLFRKSSKYTLVLYSIIDCNRLKIVALENKSTLEAPESLCPVRTAGLYLVQYKTHLQTYRYIGRMRFKPCVQERWYWTVTISFVVRAMVIGIENEFSSSWTELIFNRVNS